MKLVPTASQTVGPYFSIGMEYLCATSAPAETVTVHGQVFDANRLPVPDAVLELWHADPSGLYSSQRERSGRPAGFARIATDAEGRFSFTTCKPGAVPSGLNHMQAPHIEVLFFARGLLRHLITRMYFPDEASNATDPLLQSLPDDRRATLVASDKSASGDDLEWNIVLQGEDETVFFAW